MVKKEPKEKKRLPSLKLHGFGGGLRDILQAAAIHPATAGLAIMALTSTVKMVSGVYRETTEGQRKLSGELTGLYNGAQAIAAAAIVVPVAVGAINLAAALKAPVSPKKD